MNNGSNPESRRVIIAITDDITTQTYPMPHSELATVQQLFETGTVVCGLIYGERVIEPSGDHPRPGLTRSGPWPVKSGVVEGFAERTGVRYEQSKRYSRPSWLR